MRLKIYLRIWKNYINYMQLCNWKLLFWSCHQSFTSLMQPALIDNYLMMISRSTSKVYKQGPQLAVLNYSSLPPHLCVIAHTLFWPRWIFLFSLWILKYVLKKREEAEGCMYPCLCLLPYPIPNIIFLSVRFLTVVFFWFIDRNCCCKTIVSSASDTLNDSEGAEKL